MKSRGQRKTQDPCTGCCLHKSLCICASIPRLSFRTKLILVIHHKELRRTTNSGVLAVRSLVNSELFVRGKDHQRLDLTPILKENFKTLLLYPSDSAVELTPEFVKQQSLPLQLIVPDGNWRQASKVASRHPELQDTQHVTISTPNPESLHLRRETSPAGMATLQAIAGALAVIEGPEAVAPLFELYRKKLENTWRGRRGDVAP